MKFVAYYRVSTQRQGQSGLGLEAQQEAVRKLVEFRNGTIARSYQEIESGAKNDRTELAAAMAYAKQHNATIIVAKLDRLARDAKFLLQLADCGTPILFGDFPDLDATTPVGRMVLTQMAAVAEFERRRISERVCSALQAAKARGVKLGGHRNGRFTEVTRALGDAKKKQMADQRALELLETIKELDAEGTMSRCALAKLLNQNNVPTVSKKGNWSASSLTRLLKRIEAIHEKQRAIAAKSVRSISNRLQVKPRKVREGSSRCATRPVAG